MYRKVPLRKKKIFDNKHSNRKWRGKKKGENDKAVNKRLKFEMGSPTASHKTKTPNQKFWRRHKISYKISIPSTANKNRWFGSNEKCCLCRGNGTLNHILSGCKVALSQGRYKWRHDKALKEVASNIQTKIKENLKENGKEKQRIQFVK